MTTPTAPATVQFVLNIPAPLVAEVTAALCAAGGYPTVSPENAKAAVIDWITRTVQNVAAAKAYVPPAAPPIAGLA